MITSAEYFKAFQSNDQRIISLFYEQHERNFKQLLSSKYTITDEDFLADIYQDTIIRLWENIQRNRITIETLTTNIGGYLYGIGENVLREQLRKQKETSIEELPQLPDDTNDSIEEYEITERNRAIQDTVNNMGKPCAPLLLKFYWDQLSWDIIAQQLGYANANSAKTQKNKCMNKLKNLFKA